VDPKLISAIEDIPSVLVLIADEVVQGFMAATGKALNPQVAFTLADHLAFAIQRQHRRLVFEVPVEQDVRDLYAGEVAAGHRALVLERMHEWLPAEEEALVALHLVNAEEGSVQDGAPISREVISHIAAIVGQYMGAEIDRTGFDFTRFSSHMQHLIRRSAEGAFLANPQSKCNDWWW
jgi:beta-glucoside operon transcriptional antiterminator